jgi:rare lipoprotein A (peptidoglycan hydrolase)
MARTTLKTATLLALIATSAAVAAPVSALAATGGVASAPSASAVPQPTVRAAALATWFGPGFYGRTTACGQTLTPTVVGVANRTLPCGTLVKVSYRGHRLIVPVIDRGPYANGADWDLTSQAARALGLVDSGRVGTRVVGSVPNTPSLGLPLTATPAVTPAPLAAASAGGAAAA